MFKLDLKKIDIKKLNIDRNTILVTTFGITLLLEIIILFSVVFATSGTNKEINKLRGNLAQIEKEWPRRDNFSKQKENLKQEISEMHTKFILPQTESVLYSFISSESKGYNVQVKVLKPGAMQDYSTTKLGKFKYLPIIISAKASFHGLANFLDYLQNSKYFFDITELRITAGLPYNSIDMVICGLVKEK